jgi:hypothetical protein
VTLLFRGGGGVYPIKLRGLRVVVLGPTLFPFEADGGVGF